MSERTLWGLAGAFLAAGLAALAWFQAARADADHNFYGVDRAAQHRFAGGFALLASGCAAALFIPVVPLYALLGVVALAAIFYGTSFVRGAVDEDEP